MSKGCVLHLLLLVVVVMHLLVLDEVCPDCELFGADVAQVLLQPGVAQHVLAQLNS